MTKDKLHNHPGMEKELNVPEDHVIVDRKLLEKTTGMITRDEIREIAKNNNIVRYCNEMFRSGSCSWEDAMMVAVKTLATENNRLINDLIRIAMNSPQQIIISKTGKCYTTVIEDDGNEITEKRILTEAKQ